MPSLIDLRRRIRAVKSTQQITKAMKMIAASRLKRAQDRVVAARPFAQRMLRVLNSLVSRVESDTHPLLKMPDQRRAQMSVLMNSLIADGHTIEVIYTTGHWLDVNSLADVVKAGAFRTRSTAG